MSRRGHWLGLISTFHTTWVVKADGSGKVWVSPGIPNTANANETGEVTATQVGALQHIACPVLIAFYIKCCSVGVHAAQHLCYHMACGGNSVVRAHHSVLCWVA